MRTAAALVTLVCAVSALPSDFHFQVQSSPHDLSTVVTNRTSFWLSRIEGDAGAPQQTVSIVVGDQPTAIAIIPDDELQALGPEAFIIRAECTADADPVIAVRGNPRAIGMRGANIGNHYAMYALLQLLGVHFLHPLQPTLTPALDLNYTSVCALSVNSAPQWGTRIWHYHTMHPIDMSELFNGFDSRHSNQVKHRDSVRDKSRHRSTLTMSFAHQTIISLVDLTPTSHKLDLGLHASRSRAVLRMARRS